eukprot:CAMPEP_0183336932 /NCGR_PEP_ID=MMETSP0164_2-20130417/4764_1 /TAXON_ID=221442 /ORGANISM="Coccolithus pelagicus ssp braarudi, Strain PLY182g" /LENGTH=41 /DNA_ID= /DNA_START= /DNA_END= /DNA_ORIENTATION=
MPVVFCVLASGMCHTPHAKNEDDERVSAWADTHGEGELVRW